VRKYGRMEQKHGTILRSFEFFQRGLAERGLGLLFQETTHAVIPSFFVGLTVSALAQNSPVVTLSQHYVAGGCRFTRSNIRTSYLRLHLEDHAITLYPSTSRPSSEGHQLFKVCTSFRAVPCISGHGQIRAIYYILIFSALYGGGLSGKERQLERQSERSDCQKATRLYRRRSRSAFRNQNTCVRVRPNQS
jgi:hypothetical protein